MSNPRRANGHRRDAVRRRVLAEETLCWICGGEVDKTLPPYQSGSPEVDEVIPVSLGGSPIDRANCRLSHRLCNIRRGNGTQPLKGAKITAFETERAWGGGRPSSPEPQPPSAQG